MLLYIYIDIIYIYIYIYGDIYHQYTPFMLAYIPYMDPMGKFSIFFSRSASTFNSGKHVPDLHGHELASAAMRRYYTQLPPFGTKKRTVPKVCI